MTSRYSGCVNPLRLPLLLVALSLATTAAEADSWPASMSERYVLATEAAVDADAVVVRIYPRRATATDTDPRWRVGGTVCLPEDSGSVSSLHVGSSHAVVGLHRLAVLIDVSDPDAPTVAATGTIAGLPEWRSKYGLPARPDLTTAQSSWDLFELIPWTEVEIDGERRWGMIVVERDPRSRTIRAETFLSPELVVDLGLGSAPVLDRWEPVPAIPRSEIVERLSETEAVDPHVYEELVTVAAGEEGPSPLTPPTATALKAWTEAALAGLAASPRQLIMGWAPAEERIGPITSVRIRRAAHLEAAGVAILDGAGHLDLTSSAGTSRLIVGFVAIVAASGGSQGEVLELLLGAENLGDARLHLSVRAVTRLGDDPRWTIAVDRIAYAGRSLLLLTPDDDGGILRRELARRSWD